MDACDQQLGQHVARLDPWHALVVGHDELLLRVLLLSVLVEHRDVEVRIGRPKEAVEAAEEDVGVAILQATVLEELGLAVGILLGAIGVTVLELLRRRVDLLGELRKQLRTVEHHLDPLRCAQTTIGL